MSESPPLNFSWIDVGRLAAMGWPQTVANLSYLVSQGIGTLVTLSPERRPPVQFPPELSHREIPIEEFQVPTFEQIDEFIEICRKNHSENQAVGIHCRQGRGRTGTMAACYVVYFQNMPPQRAVLNVRLLRPGSIETYGQEKVVEEYHDYLRRNQPSTN
ncbi:hypothetical protein RUM44_000873 [Polyplax serrata]|uniref:Dual specificity protein phosphatase 23 n=1 Tax=Polyplax serrata TaxID=468196 RepID=A0ABR1B8V8_POLSC